jgi:hypothetical protein
MSILNAVKGSCLIYKALSILDYKIDANLVHNLVVNVEMKRTSISVNGNSFNDFELCDNDRWNLLLELCGYSCLKDKPIRSMIINMRCDEVANVDINLICEVK